MNDQKHADQATDLTQLRDALREATEALELARRYGRAAQALPPMIGGSDPDIQLFRAMLAGTTLAPPRAAFRHSNERTIPQKVGEQDSIARAKRILEAVDTYTERPDRFNRTALRCLLLDEFDDAHSAAPTPPQRPRAG